MPLVLMTPNYTGRDGISRLSRAIVDAVPGPATVIALHDPVGRDAGGRVQRIGCGGSTPRFLWESTAARVTPGTRVICTHAHLAPAMRTLAWRGAETTLVLCGIEAWSPLPALRRRSLARVDRLIAISKHTVDRFREANPWSDAPIAVCHPGVPDTARRGGAPTSEALIVGRMSSAERYKGHDALIELWPALLRDAPGARLRIVGGGDDRARLQSRAAALGLGHAIRFAGEVDDAELDAMYAGAAFFVMPSRHEGFGLVFLEAMRAGLACVGAPGAAAEIIDDTRTGFLADPQRPDQVFGALRRLFLDDAARARLGAAGRARYLGHFTDAHFAQRLHAAMGDGALPAVVRSVRLGADRRGSARAVRLKPDARYPDERGG